MRYLDVFAELYERMDLGGDLEHFIIGARVRQTTRCSPATSSSSLNLGVLVTPRPVPATPPSTPPAPSEPDRIPPDELVKKFDRYMKQAIDRPCADRDELQEVLADVVDGFLETLDAGQERFAEEYRDELWETLAAQDFFEADYVVPEATVANGDDDETKRQETTS